MRYPQQNPVSPEHRTSARQPPSWTDRLLTWFCPSELLEELLGDLHEQFDQQVAEFGPAKARRLYIWEVLRFCRPYFIRQRVIATATLSTTNRSTSSFSQTMLRNYFTIAFRTLRSNKAYTILNVLGLSLGLGCGILIFLVVRFHLSVDRYHAKADRTYRVVTSFHYDTDEDQPGVPIPLAQALRTEYPFVEQVALRIGQRNRLITVPTKPGQPTRKFNEDNKVCFVEQPYFNILDYQWLQGNPQTALTQPGTVVLTQRQAQKYFGSADPIGKHLTMSNQLDLQVTGILADPPSNTDQVQEVFISFASLRQFKQGIPPLDDWGTVSSRTNCFITLPSGVSPNRLTHAFPALCRKYLSAEDAKHTEFLLVALPDMHTNQRFDGPISQAGLTTQALIGVLLLLTACINFINLATAQALRRAKEVGVRKTVGSTRPQLFGQFMTETSLIVVTSILVGVGLARVGLPLVNEWFRLHLSLNPLADAQIIAFLLGTGVVVVLLAGSYPGLVLAGFQPVMALKGKIGSRQIGGLSLRRGLVVLQFVITQLLLIGTLVVTTQLDFFRHADLGYQTTAKVLLPLPVDSTVNLETLRSRFREVPGVQAVSFCSFAPTSGANNTTDFKFDSRQQNEPWQASVKAVDTMYLHTFGLRLLAGRNLPESDTARGVIVNETFIKKLGISNPQAVLGKLLQPGNTPVPIVGVVRDWKNQSLRNDVDPLILLSQKRSYQTCALAISPQQMISSLKGAEQVWNSTFPNFLYEQTFLDDRIAQFYQAETTLLNMVRLFSLIAIFIGCLGLYGLVSFMIAQKTKEIGVRKVLGATVGQILGLFAKEFGGLILVAFLIAAPLGGWLMTHWLADYAYHVSLSVSIFFLTIGLTALIAALTVSIQSVKAALVNPVKSLRSE